MPIYAYKCASCGHAKDVLQKFSDAPLSTCPACGAESFTKQVTAAGFQLKGSGWYATDFRGGSGAPAADKPADAAKPAEATPSAGTKTESSAAKPTESVGAGKSEPPSASASAGASDRA